MTRSFVFGIPDAKVRAMVAGIDDQRVVRQAKPFQVIANPAQVAIQTIDATKIIGVLIPSITASVDKITRNDEIPEPFF